MEEIPASLADSGPSPADSASERARAGLLRQALERIPDHYRVPLILVHVEGLAVGEAARALDLPEGTVKSRLFRARAMLKEIIERHYPALAPAGAAGGRP
jgi:RNA polymerase sigma-70 factor (ECF subfamily)